MPVSSPTPDLAAPAVEVILAAHGSRDSQRRIEVTNSPADAGSTEAHDNVNNIRHAITINQDIIASYRSLAYKILLAHAALVIAILYFLATESAKRPQVIAIWSIHIPFIPPNQDTGSSIACRDWWGAGIGIAVVTALLAWWLGVINVRSDQHVARAKRLWIELRLEWDKPEPSATKEAGTEGVKQGRLKRLLEWALTRRAWAPVYCLPIALALVAEVWIIISCLN